LTVTVQRRAQHHPANQERTGHPSVATSVVSEEDLISGLTITNSFFLGRPDRFLLHLRHIPPRSRALKHPLAELPIHAGSRRAWYRSCRRSGSAIPNQRWYRSGFTDAGLDPVMFTIFLRGSIARLSFTCIRLGAVCFHHLIFKPVVLFIDFHHHQWVFPLLVQSGLNSSLVIIDQAANQSATVFPISTFSVLLFSFVISCSRRRRFYIFLHRRRIINVFKNHLCLPPPHCDHDIAIVKGKLQDTLPLILDA